jgi:hypothetical protein
MAGGIDLGRYKSKVLSPKMWRHDEEFSGMGITPLHSNPTPLFFLKHGKSPASCLYISASNPQLPHVTGLVPSIA